MPFSVAVMMSVGMCVRGGFWTGGGGDEDDGFGFRFESVGVGAGVVMPGMMGVEDEGNGKDEGGDEGVFVETGLSDVVVIPADGFAETPKHHVVNKYIYQTEKKYVRISIRTLYIPDTSSCTSSRCCCPPILLFSALLLLLILPRRLVNHVISHFPKLDSILRWEVVPEIGDV
jgi:hypothetical protein